MATGGGGDGEFRGGGGGDGELGGGGGDGELGGGGGEGELGAVGQHDDCLSHSHGYELTPLALVPPSPLPLHGSFVLPGISEDPLSHYVSDDEINSEIWELYIQFDGVKFVQKSMARSEIRYLNLLSIMEAEGYGICDTMYYVKDQGEGLAGLDAVDSSRKVEEMIKKYESSKKLVLTVMRDKRKHAIVLSPVKNRNAGKSQPIHIDLDAEEGEHIPEHYQTQTSVYCEKIQTQICDNAMSEEEEGEKSDDSYSWWDEGQYDKVHAEEMRKKDEEELRRTLAEMKRKRDDPLLHCEGDTDVEDIYDKQSEDSEPIVEEEPIKKKIKKQGPTLRSHSQVEIPNIPDWAPSDDEQEVGFIKEEDDDGFEPISFILPKGRKSRAKKAKERVWYDETRENAEQQFMQFLCFKDVYQFRQALARLHIVQTRNFHYHRNCKDRIIVWCKEKERYDCKFYMSASQIKNENTFCIKKIHVDHSCPTEPLSSRVNSSWLSTVYVDKFRSDPNTCITSLMDKAKKDYGVEVHKRMAYRAKNKAREMVLGGHKIQYHRIRDYLQTVLDKNPGSRCIVTTATGPTEEQLEQMKQGQAVVISDKPRFHGLFFCVNAAKLGFLEGCRPFIGLDGCFIKLTTGAQILAATGRDGNNNMYPIAWAVVAKEDTENWVWFLEQLKEALGGEAGKFGNYTIMSDRQKGLIKAVSTVFPNCPQRFCLRHIYANFQTAGFRGEDLKKCMDNAAYSYTRHGFDLAMEEMKKQCELAWTWLSKIPVHTWARWAMDTNCKTDLVVNNLSEVFNRYILDVRSKPIVTMLVGIYDKQMVRFDGKREGVGSAKWEITPHYAEKLELMKKYSRNCVPKRSDVGLWQVKSGNHTEEVNLDAASCTCRKWDMSGMPCNHAVAAIYKAKLHPEDFVSNFFKKPMYLSSYKHVFYPMPEQHGWTKTNTEDIMPPGFKDHQKGRRQEKRRKGKFEVPKPKDTSRMATITCGNCKLQGHTYLTCLVPLRPDLAIRKNNHRANRSMPAAGTEASSSSTICSGTPPAATSSADSSTAPRQAPRTSPSAGSSTICSGTPPAAAAARQAFTAPRQASVEQAATGIMSYLTAGANAGPGRDANSDPLARNARCDDL